MAQMITGDFEINNFTITSERGTIDIKYLFISASIYESILVPGTICDILIIDTEDKLGTFKLSGDETVDFSYVVPGSTEANYTFAIYNLSGLESNVSQKSKTYTLQCCSFEIMRAKRNNVQKDYYQLCSEVVNDIHTTYLMSDKPIVLENTKGPQNLRVNHMNPFEAINFARQRSASDDNNKSSSFVYFENMQNEEQTYNFVTIESLFRQEPSKFYRQSSTIASDFFQRTDDVIISYSVPTQFSSIDKLVYGGPRKISQFNFTTLEYNSNIINTSDSVFATGGSGQSDTSSNFKQQYDQDSIPPQSMIAVDISQRSSTFIPESTPDLQAYLAILLQNSMKI